MLSGLLHPSAGTAQVLGFEPWKRSRDYLRRMTLVMGNRSQLEWDIPAADSFELNRVVYRLERADFEQTLAELVELLDLRELIRKPVRNLSLGERMKVELAAALLHRPQVLFLDEPTLGLDVTMQRRIRSFVAEYNARTGATVLLTSHYMADVEALCKRVIVIHHGSLLYDGNLSGLVERFAPYKTIALQLANGAADIPEGGLGRYGEVIEQEGGNIRLQVPKAETAAITGRLLADLAIADLTVEEPPIDRVIEQVFAHPGSGPGLMGPESHSGSVQGNGSAGSAGAGGSAMAEAASTPARDEPAERPPFLRAPVDTGDGNPEKQPEGRAERQQ
jgi:ABC-2 type transport system ATP-binding protein